MITNAGLFSFLFYINICFPLLKPNIIVFSYVGIGVHFIMRNLSKYFPDNWISAAICLLVFIIVFFQFSRWQYLSDQSDNSFFSAYATALLTGLPKDALLFINYDQQVRIYLLFTLLVLFFNHFFSGLVLGICKNVKDCALT
jgi:hypothetical protein